MSGAIPTARLDRLLANLGYSSRREIGLMAQAGWIVLDGRTLDDVGQRVRLEPDLPERLRIKGHPLDPLPGLALMVHKPLGVTCSRKEAGPLIYDLLPPRWRRREPAISTVGRLDKDTSGLLLMTDDGDLLHRIISPRNHVAKRYQVTLARPLVGTEADIIGAGGLMLEGDEKPLLPATMTTTSPQQATLILHEGRYHQVRRMFAALGNHVTALHRDRIGALGLPHDLSPGQIRILTDAQRAAIFAVPE
ncbi:MAG: hypothetical protein RLZZ157_882 [Pseudomonadota bacterium]